MVEHLDELRSRMIICLLALVVAFGVCFWQNHALIHLVNRALPHVSTAAGQHGLGAVPNQSVQERQGFLQTAGAYTHLAALPSTTPAARQAYTTAAQGLRTAAAALPKTAQAQEKPITIGVGEPFMTTLTVSAYFAVMITLPLLIWQLYAFVIPALSAEEKRAVLPAMFAAPFLFIAGVVFAFFVVLPPAVHFLQGYNSSEFDILVQAKTYYTFEMLTMLGIGLAFQLPLALLAMQRIGVINGRTLTRNWRYATVGIAVIAAAMPGADPVTTGLEMLPLVILYLSSIVLLKIADRRAAARAAAEQTTTAFGDGLDPT